MTEYRSYAPGSDVTCTATENLVGGRIVTPTTGGSPHRPAVKTADTGDHPLGIAARDADDGQLAHVQRGGILRLSASGTISAGATVTTAASGKVSAASSGDPIVGVAVTAAAEGEEVAVAVS